MVVKRIEIDYERCLGCKECVRACTYGVLEWFEDIPIVVDLTRCAGCRACEEKCPADGITVYDL